MTQSSPRPPAGEQEQILADIERTRNDLGRSVQALAAKVDVPARMKDKAGQAREQLGGTLATLRGTARAKAPEVPGKVGTAVQKAGRRPKAIAAVAGVCAVAGLMIWRRRRS